ncbi:bifunctional phosphopantothenoylcysteine decarboxylase/phosphopantothenate--cysteine ligase CoaBC [Helicobacter mesocricetorum]|uniref:bifunctional phosphopantothenoylcysteine decarboxylase/phosphopantothenate--cysteine ligase CoaBC n=1 Tax=Helicobacter mesocricetorum TaxID=87012 RepID=UPI000CF08400|nr:bifunctional phosphopantothenoylcysteine decarboxylase/phosphopantothenate--cysteine ligase CoaBC [Helicobacter mesocricetorum]
MIEHLPKLLKGKKIILGVCGSIAIYKSIEILRSLEKLGAEVRVVMTKKAKTFIQPLLFEALSHHQVLHKDSQNWGESPCNHIELAKWGDMFLIAPTTANTINKLACGIADNILLESFLAFDKIKIIAPAANTKMIENPITKKSLETLSQIGMTIIASQSKELACKEIGNGGLAEPLEIIYEVLRMFFKDDFWLQKKVCISSGGSKEKIDNVRYLSNFSSGKMGANLALSAYFLGAEVCYIYSIESYPLPLGIKKIKVQTTQEYLQAIQNWQQKIQNPKNAYLIMNAAISDYVPQTFIQKKLKKQEIGKEWNLALKENIDILQSIKKSQITIGFKLEDENGINNALQTLNKKSLDAICLNEISPSFSPMDSKDNKIIWITKDLQKNLGYNDKLHLSFAILNEAKNL